MRYIKKIMKEEHQRLQDLYRKYMDKIDSLPKGAVSIKKRNNREYLYLASRRNGKVKFDYIGSVASENARKVLEQVKFRKDFVLKLKQVKGDLREIERVLRGRKI